MKAAIAPQAPHEIVITTDTVHLPGFLSVPEEAHGIVIFAHGSGSSRFSRRNQQVAGFLNESHHATLLFDLLSAEENAEDQFTRRHRFNIPLLAGRLVAAVDFVANDRYLKDLPIGLFGASTGAAAALIAAAERPEQVCAVVSRGGRPDLAGEALAEVKSPVMLIVGERDPEVIDLNRHAARQLNVKHRSVIIPGATHLFEEPGTLEEVERLAAEWFDDWLARREASES